MQFKLLHQDDSVYCDHGITIELKNWNDWEEFCIARSIKRSLGELVPDDIETRWDLAECRECQVISPEHLGAYFKWITKTTGKTKTRS